jgi:hypothetical protein
MSREHPATAAFKLLFVVFIHHQWKLNTHVNMRNPIESGNQLLLDDDPRADLKNGSLFQVDESVGLTANTLIPALDVDGLGMLLPSDYATGI